jgi:hypothetical protein
MQPVAWYPPGTAHAFAAQRCHVEEFPASCERHLAADLVESMDAPALDDRVAIDGAMSMSLATMPPGTATAQL